MVTRGERYGGTQTAAAAYGGSSGRRAGVEHQDIGEGADSDDEGEGSDDENDKDNKDDVEETVAKYWKGVLAVST